MAGLNFCSIDSPELKHALTFEARFKKLPSASMVQKKAGRVEGMIKPANKLTTPERIEILLDACNVPKRKQRQALADVCGIKHQAVRQWFTGDTNNIAAENLYKIAKRFSSSVEWLVAGDGPMIVSGGVVEFADPGRVARYNRLTPAERELLKEYAERLIASRPPEISEPIPLKQKGIKNENGRR